MQGHNSVSVQALRSFVERIQRLEEEIQTINAEKRDVYAEAKATGFDVKVMKKIIADLRKDTAERAEFNAIYELYAAALGIVPSTGTEHATRVQAHEIPPGDLVEGVEVHPRQSEPATFDLTDGVYTVPGAGVSQVRNEPESEASASFDEFPEMPAFLRRK